MTYERDSLVLNTLKSNQLKDPFQSAWLAVPLAGLVFYFCLLKSLWSANRDLEIGSKDKSLLVAFYPWYTWEHLTLYGLVLRTLYNFEYSSTYKANKIAVRSVGIW